jgi:hypothetical protein
MNLASFNIHPIKTLFGYVPVRAFAQYRFGVTDTFDSHVKSRTILAKSPHLQRLAAFGNEGAADLRRFAAKVRHVHSDRPMHCQILYFFWQFGYVVPEPRGLE